MNHQYKNLRPLREGSTLYKASHDNGLYSAVKIFPYVFSEEQKRQIGERSALIKSAIEDYHSDIPALIDWGISGSSSYIEFDWIIGMSLGEKFKTERNSLLTISEVLLVAEQISRTLTFCHKINLQHNALTQDDIIWDAAKKRYALTGFFNRYEAKNTVQDPLQEVSGFIMDSAEERQKKDIKDISILLMQFLTGTANVESLDANQLNLAREKAIPAQWTMDKFEEEKFIPSWFTQLLADGLSGNQFNHMGDFYFSFIRSNKQPITERKYRSQPYVQLPIPPVKKVEKISELYTLPVVLEKNKPLRRFVFDGKMATGLLMAALLFGFSMYSQKKHSIEKPAVSETELASVPVTNLVREIEPEEPPAEKKEKEVKKEEAIKIEEPSVPAQEVVAAADTSIEKPDPVPAKTPQEEKATETEGMGFYMVKSKAFFHNEPDEATQRKGFIIHWNNAILIPIKEENDFVYVVFTNKEGQTSRGWLKKSDLMEVGDK